MLLGPLCRRNIPSTPRISTIFLQSRPWSSTRYIQTQSSDIPRERFRILFMGRDEFSCLVLQELYNAKDVWQEIVIATQPDVHVGRRGSVLAISPLKIFGEKYGIPVYTIPKSKREFKTWELPPPFSQVADPLPPHNHLLVTASFGRILSSRMLGSFRPSRRLNVHPSLLPAYRGPAPIQHTILNGEKKTGVCVIEMLKKSEGIDAGSLWGCHEMDMPPNPTFPSLRDELAIAGGKLLVSVLGKSLHGMAIARPQPANDNVPNAPFITANDTAIDFRTMDADAIHRRFRALSHQKPLFTTLPDGRLLQLVHLSSVDPESPALVALPSEPGSTTLSGKRGILLIRCSDGSVLGASTVKPEGKAERGAAEFWNGLREVKSGAKHVVLNAALG